MRSSVVAEPDLQNDRMSFFIGTFTRLLQKHYASFELPPPLFSQLEQLLLRKSLENTEMPLTLP
jgi:hypothetical protein